MNVQQRLDKCDFFDLIELPIGEFEGPFVVRKPCTIVGSTTTLWAKKGPVLTIESNDVKLMNLQIEVTESSDKASESLAVASKGENHKFEEVEIVGGVQGVADEEKEWHLPRVIALGEIPAQIEATYQLELTVSNLTKLYSLVKDIEVFPQELHPGRNIVTIKTALLRENSFIYGDLLLVSTFLRRMYISGNVVNKANGYLANERIFPQQAATATNSAAIAQPNSAPPMVPRDNVTLLKKGQRQSINGVLSHQFQVYLSYASLQQRLDVDPYVFLLDQHGKAEQDDKLIFFGNTQSKCGGVQYRESAREKLVAIDLDRIPSEIHKVSICYAVYEDSSNSNFSMIASPTVRIVADEEDRVWFAPEELKFEKTVVFLEFYRHQQDWKVNPIGAGYHEGLKRLCESFGLEVL